MRSLVAPTEYANFQAAASEYHYNGHEHINRPLLSCSVPTSSSLCGKLTRAWSSGGSRRSCVARIATRQALAFDRRYGCPDRHRRGTTMVARTAGAFIDEPTDPWAWVEQRTTGFAPCLRPEAARRLCSRSMREWHDGDASTTRC